ncbi:hypothetical protein QQ045_024564 [Rhodiola kirilowii]
MDVDEFQSQIYSKYPRVSTNSNGGGGRHNNKLANYTPEDEDDADDMTRTPTSNNDNAAVTVATQPQSSADSMFRGWHNSSRIFRVSRASGGKDRHSKVLTSKGLRDRRVRLSVSTAIQFYDLQDRLGYDQPSKAVEWLIKAAADSISELPSLHGPFPETPRHLCDVKLGFESAAGAAEVDTQSQQQQKNLSMSKSPSSTSETSKGSGLSLTRTDVRVNQRVKARERARERAKEKECEGEQAVNVGQRRRQTSNPISHHNTSSSFTELLTCGNQSGSSPNSTPMNYLSNHHQAACLFLGQTQMGNSINMPSGFHLTTGEHHHHHQHEAQHFSFGQENNLISTGNEYDLNFSISSSPSSLPGYNNRGTLQSNSPSAASSLMHHNLQRYASPIEGSNVPAFFMTTAASSSMNTNHHHFSTGLDGSLHLYYGDHGGSRQSDHKDKGKN